MADAIRRRNRGAVKRLEDPASILRSEGVEESAIWRVSPLVRLDPDSGCLVWQLSVTNTGSPQISVGHRCVLVARFLYAAAGKLKEDSTLLRTCENKRCVRPSHRIQVERAAGAWAASYRRRPSRKLSDAQLAVLRIYLEREAKRRIKVFRRLARRWGFHVETLRSAAKEGRWQWLEP